VLYRFQPNKDDKVEKYLRIVLLIHKLAISVKSVKRENADKLKPFSIGVAGGGGGALGADKKFWGLQVTIVSAPPSRARVTF